MHQTLFADVDYGWSCLIIESFALCFLCSSYSMRSYWLLKSMKTHDFGTCSCPGAAEPASVGVSWWHLSSPQGPHKGCRKKPFWMSQVKGKAGKTAAWNLMVGLCFKDAHGKPKPLVWKATVLLYDVGVFLLIHGSCCPCCLAHPGPEIETQK